MTIPSNGPSPTGSYNNLGSVNTTQQKTPPASLDQLIKEVAEEITSYQKKATEIHLKVEEDTTKLHQEENKENTFGNRIVKLLLDTPIISKIFTFVFKSKVNELNKIKNEELRLQEEIKIYSHQETYFNTKLNELANKKENYEKKFKENEESFNKTLPSGGTYADRLKAGLSKKTETSAISTKPPEQPDSNPVKDERRVRFADEVRSEDKERSSLDSSQVEVTPKKSYSQILQESLPPTVTKESLPPTPSESFSKALSEEDVDYEKEKIEYEQFKEKYAPIYDEEDDLTSNIEAPRKELAEELETQRVPEETTKEKLESNNPYDVLYNLEDEVNSTIESPKPQISKKEFVEEFGGNDNKYSILSSLKDEVTEDEIESAPELTDKGIQEESLPLQSETPLKEESEVSRELVQEPPKAPTLEDAFSDAQSIGDKYGWNESNIKLDENSVAHQEILAIIQKDGSTDIDEWLRNHDVNSDEYKRVQELLNS